VSCTFADGNRHYSLVKSSLNLRIIITSLVTRDVILFHRNHNCTCLDNSDNSSPSDHSIPLINIIVFVRAMLTIDVERVIAARLKVFIEFNDEISRSDQFGFAMSVVASDDQSKMRSPVTEEGGMSANHSRVTPT